MGELEKEYNDRATFEMRNLQDDGILEESAQYEFGPSKHGLVGIKGDKAVVLLVGHNYGKPEIRAKLEEFLN